MLRCKGIEIKAMLGWMKRDAWFDAGITRRYVVYELMVTTQMVSSST